ncbi:MAG: DUF1330 domain-containing protein [Alphaproteobacteria bacterium]|nr:DUF1330 domain-containing protein [Alphaproteobacteria bacterium]
MNVENAVYPKGEQIQALIGRNDGKPIVMLNLLKFKDKAVYKDGRATDLTGREAYQKYADLMVPFVLSHGGRIVFSGAANGQVIGDVGELWDVVALMEYPSAEAFAKIAMSPDVAKFGEHREAGLAGQLLIEVREQ